MTLGETLLNLAAEYQQLGNREDWGVGAPNARTKADIAAEYEDNLRELLK